MSLQIHALDLKKAESQIISGEKFGKPVDVRVKTNQCSQFIQVKEKIYPKKNYLDFF